MIHAFICKRIILIYCIACIWSNALYALIRHSSMIKPSRSIPTDSLISRRSSITNSMSSSSPTSHNPKSSSFELSEYMSSILDRIRNKEKPIEIKFTNSVPIEDNNKPSYIILVDINIRDIKDIKAANLDTEIPNIYRFINKLVSSQNSLSIDKFLYTHDVGESHVDRMSIARIPQSVGDKLVLSRKIAESVNSSPSEIIVVMLTDGGNRMIDQQMCHALVSGIQMNNFNMPSMKCNAGGGIKSGRSSAYSSDIIPVVTFLSTSIKDDDNAGDAMSDGIITNTDDYVEQVEAQWSSFYASNLQQNPQSTSMTDAPTTNADILTAGKSNRDRKISALEKAMIEASQKSYGKYLDAGSNDNSDESVISQSIDNLLSELTETIDMNEGANIARALASLPPNVLNPTTYSTLLHEVAATLGCDIDEWTAEELRDQGCGAFYSVVQGNPLNTNDKLVRLRKSNKRKGKVIEDNAINFPSTSVKLGESYFSTDYTRPIVLVGKGVCYDTGGINAKTANSMKTMKHDMAGSSAALGTFISLSKSSVFPYTIECWLAIVENNISPTAYRPDDVVTAVTGDTIEIVHTDAEGRMLLADVLALASRQVLKPSFHDSQDTHSPKLLIDYATLTGTCISSLSNRYIGAFCNKREKNEILMNVGDRCGERLWPFPLDKDFEDDLVSDVADVLQCRQPTEADHIYAATFLNRFVNPTSLWVHLDLGSAHRPGGLGHVGTDFTGSGVRASLQIIKDIIE